MKASALLLALLAGVATLGTQALAQTAYPAKAVRIVVPYPAGGGSDFMARTLGAQMAAELGQSFVVDNKTGGNGAIAAQDVIRGGPDGYTLMNADNGQLVFNPALYKSLTYKVSDFTPVTTVGTVSMMLITGPHSEFKDIRDFIGKAKANPGKYSVASAGLGTPHHMALEMLKRQAGLFLVNIPYRGAAPSLVDVAGGQVPLAVSDLGAARSFVTEGKVKVLAVFSKNRLPQMPDVPTLAEVGISGAEAAAIVGLVAPTGTPPEAIARLQQAAAKALAMPAVRDKFIHFGIEPGGIPTADYVALLQAETTRWHKLIRDLKITLD